MEYSVNFSKYIPTIDGKIYSVYSKRYINTNIGPNGYYHFLTGDRNNHTVHSVTARFYLGKCPPGYTVNHINGIKTDNRIENLEYVTRSDNQKHAFKMALQSQEGQKNSRSKLKDLDVIEIKKLLNLGYSHQHIATLFKVSRANISLIHSNKRWSHINGT